jgi:hypothetical protein
MRLKSVSSLPDRLLLGGGADEDTPLAKAQTLVYRAFGEDDEGQRVRLAREALDICADCADAYVLLAEHAPSRKEALSLTAASTAWSARMIRAR